MKNDYVTGYRSQFLTRLVFLVTLMTLIFSNYLFSQTTFSNPTPYLNENAIYGGKPAAISVDMDGDGDLDIVTSNDNNSSNAFVIVGINNGSGVFNTSVKVNTHKIIRDFAVGDLNNDGLPDISVVAEPDGNWTFQVILNTTSGGNLSLGNPSNYNGLGFNANGRGISIADVNNDGNNDLVITKDNASEELIVSHGNGTGTNWPISQSINVSGTVNLNGHVLADFDNDGIKDVVASRGGSRTLYLFKGNNNGTFSNATTFYTGIVINELEYGDFNDDGLNDLVVNVWNNSSHYILLNSGNGTSFSQSTVNSGFGAVTLPTVVDFDSDGNLDLVYSNRSSLARLGIMKGNGDGSFQAPENYSYTENSASVAADGVGVGDYNADGKPDAAVIDRKVWVFLNTTIPPVVPPATTCGTVLDFDGANDYVSVPYSAAHNTAIYSFALWAKVEGSPGTYRSPISNRDHNPRSGWKVYAGNNNMWQFWQGGNDQWQSAASNVPVIINEWVHLAGSYDGTSMRFYVNGQLVVTKVAPYSMNQFAEMRIGAGANDSPVSAYYFNGKIDELSIWSKVISQTEIQQMKLNGLIGNETNLESYWKFDDGSGSSILTDYSGNNHNGTLQNMSPASDWEDADYSNCSDDSGCGTVLDFDGANDYVSVPHSTGNNTAIYSFALWAKVEGSIGTYRSPVSNRDHNPRSGWKVYAGNNNRWQFWQGGNNQWQSAASNVPVVLNEWVHLAGSYDGSAMRFYVNGQLVVTKVAPYSANQLAEMRIGAGANDSPGSAYYFNGKIDDLSVWSKVLSAIEISNIISNGITGNESSLESYWDFNDGTGSTMLSDKSGNGNNGSLTFMDAATDWEASDNCGATAGRQEFVETDIAQEEIAEGKTFYTYNQSGMFHVIIKNQQVETANVQLIDLTGRSVFNKNVTFENGKWSMPSSVFKSKVYLMLIKSDSEIIKSKVVIE